MTRLNLVSSDLFYSAKFPVRAKSLPIYINPTEFVSETKIRKTESNRMFRSQSFTKKWQKKY